MASGIGRTSLETKMLAKYKNTQAGFSILEIPIALFIITVMLLIYAAASNTLLLNRDTRYKEIAHRIANNQMENLRDMGYANLPAAGSFSHASLVTLPQGQASMAFSDFNADIKEVNILVRWKGVGNATTHAVSLTTLIYKNGVSH